MLGSRVLAHLQDSDCPGPRGFQIWDSSNALAKCKIGRHVIVLNRYLEQFTLSMVKSLGWYLQWR